MFKSIYRSFSLLPKPARIRYLLVLLNVLLINVLDLLAISILGSIISLTPQFSSNLKGKNQSEPVWVHIGIWKFETTKKFFLLAIVIVLVIFLLRTYFSLIISRRIFIFLGTKQAEVSATLLGRLQNVKYSWLRKQDWQSLIYVITDGANSAIVGVLGQFATLFSEGTLSLLILVFLLTVKFSWTVILIFIGFLIVFSLNRLLASRSLRLGQAISDSSVQTRRNAFDAISLFQELRLSSKEEYFLEEFRENRLRGATSYGRATWLQQFPKYVFEMLITISALTLLVLATQTEINKKTYLIFLIAISRVLPALARINTLIISIKASVGSSILVYDTVEELFQNSRSASSLTPSSQTMKYQRGPSHLKVSNVSFQYEDDEHVLLENISFEIKPGKMSALIGPSGSGKSTLIEMVSGFFQPNSGEVTLDNLPIQDFVDRFPGKIAYVSQSPYFLSSSILENVALGVPLEQVDLNLVANVLEKAGALQFIQRLPSGIHTLLTEGGSRFSGGQRQRIALARALYTNPSFLILDEATSALDGETEDLIISSLDSLKETTSILIIAHRYATIEFADEIHLMVNGRIIDRGTWSEISSRNKNIMSRVDIRK